MAPKNTLRLWPVFSALLICLSLAAPASAGFREDFIRGYMENRFDYLATLVKQNRETAPAEIKALVKEAMDPARSAEERLDMLNVANIMASMYKHWHNDAGPLAQVESVQKAEVQKEEARLAEKQKRDKYEKFTGNTVIKTRIKEMEAKGQTPVIFPHWVHRLYFECKACHDSPFEPKRSKGLSHEAFKGASQCGLCHNSKTSFSTEENCQRCHIIAKKGEERLSTPVITDELEQASIRLKYGPDAAKLKDKKLPLDRLGSIDWGSLRKSGAYAPAKSVKDDFRDETRENVIIFDIPMTGIKSVPFDHKTHSTQAACSTCHKELFKESLGANKSTMANMADGKSCGACHGKVAFKLADCNRCHTGEAPASALKRK